MDIFGEALRAYLRGDRSPFYLKDRASRLFKTDLSRYFRKTSQISPLEKRLIASTYGNILDVGCGTGNYLPLMARRGHVHGIDTSATVISVAKEMGCRTCEVADIFTFAPTKRFDTITFLGNGLGIGGTVNKTARLLRKLSKLLKDDGQILAIGRRVVRGEYVAVQLKPVWKQKVGSSFDWIHISRELLSDLCERTGFRLAVLAGNQHYYLFRIVKM